jgi:hypothetical protein
MGYRSSVKSLIYGEFKPMQEFIEHTKLIEENNPLELFKDSIVYQKLKNGASHSEWLCIELQGEDWKWYESFPDVQAWLRLLNSAKKMGLQYELTLVGEDGCIEEDRTADCEYFIATHSYSEINYTPSGVYHAS